jgi:hypothetical protein
LLQTIDSELGKPCVIQQAAAGRFSCAPPSWGRVIFLDAACTEPLIETQFPEERWVSTIGYAPYVGVAKLGPRRANATGTAFMGGADTACSPAGMIQDPVFAVEELVPFDQWAAGAVEEVDRGPLGATYFRGDDGSSFLLTLVDRTAEVECSPADTEAGPRCRAEIFTVNDTGLLDASCERLAIIDYTVPPVAKVPERGDEVFRFASQQLDGLEVMVGRREPDGSCAVEARSLGRMTLFLGEPYPPSAWPPLAFDRSSGALGAAVPTFTSGGSAEALDNVDASELFEADGQACGPVWSGERLRCLPPTPDGPLRQPLLHADAACSRRVIALRASEQDPPALVTAHDGTGVAGLPIGGRFSLGARLSTEAVFEKSSRGCLPRSGGPLVFELGAPAPVEALPELVLVD